MGTSLGSLRLRQEVVAALVGTAFVAGAAVSASILFHACFEYVPIALLQFVAHPPLMGTKDLPIAVIEFLDDLERPPSGDQVASDEVGLQPFGHLIVPGLSPLLHGLAEQQVGLPDQLVRLYRCPRARSTYSNASDTFPTAATVCSLTPDKRRSASAAGSDASSTTARYPPITSATPLVNHAVRAVHCHRLTESSRLPFAITPSSCGTGLGADRRTALLSGRTGPKPRAQRSSVSVSVKPPVNRGADQSVCHREDLPPDRRKRSRPAGLPNLARYTFVW
jgi:hypothetical protein